MTIREGVSAASRRFHLTLPADLETELAAFARQHGLGLGPAMRLLATQALERGGPRQSESPAALAALTAAEHAVLMVASILPEGERRMRELGQPATLAAEDRLALFMSTAESER